MDFEIRELANALDRVSARGKAAVFGICARALAPLLEQAERRSDGRWSFPEVDVALDLVEAFATGLAEAADHTALRERLMSAVPHGHDLNAPWSTYAQDALICTDAGLAAATAGVTPKSIWIQYALEPLMTSMQIRDSDEIRMGGDDLWSRSLVADPVMASALDFLRAVISEAGVGASMVSAKFDRLAEEAAILRAVGL